MNARTMLEAPRLSESAARAHAMKNCVSVIHAIVRLVEPELDERGRERMKRLRLASDRLRELLAREIAGAEAMASHAGFSVEALVRSVLLRVVDRAEVAGVELVVECRGGTMIGDEASLHEALFNLVCNGIEATPRGGRVSVVTHETEDGDQRWLVRDTGAGIPSEHLGDVGRPFRSRRAGGSGLGLALANAAIREHGGLMRVESAVEVGTTITMWLPRARQSVDVAPDHRT